MEKEEEVGEGGGGGKRKEGRGEREVFTEKSVAYGRRKGKVAHQEE